MHFKALLLQSLQHFTKHLVGAPGVGENSQGRVKLSELTGKASQGRGKRGHWELVKGRLLLGQARETGREASACYSQAKLRTFSGILLLPMAMTEALSNEV